VIYLISSVVTGEVTIRVFTSSIHRLVTSSPVLSASLTRAVRAPHTTDGSEAAREVLVLGAGWAPGLILEEWKSLKRNW
jgi:hypothetical protein